MDRVVVRHGPGDPDRVVAAPGPGPAPATLTAPVAELLRLLPGVLWESEVVDWRAIFVSPNALALTGYEADDWVRIREFWEDRLHPDDRALTMQAVDEAIEAGASGSYDYRWRVADGSYRWFRDRLRVIDGGHGRKVMSGIMVDVTAEYDERAARDAATVERDRLAQALDQSTAAVIITDASRVITYVNPAFQRMTGYTGSEAAGHRTIDLLRAEIIPGVSDLAEIPGPSVAWSGEIEARRKDGSPLRLISSVVPIRDTTGRVMMRMGVHHDVTRVRELEAQLAQTAKLEAIGQLAGGVAHDFNNLLTAILGYASFLADGLPPDSRFQGDIAEIRAAGERAQRLTAQLLAFGRRAVLRPAVVDVGLLVAEIAPMLTRLIGEDIRFRLEGPTEPATAFVDGGQLQQAVINLVVNARNAMPDGGEIGVRVDVVGGEGGAATPPWVVVAVRDTGVGMTPDVLARVFEPFFTTREFGGGTGLGLAVVDGFVRQSRGEVKVTSEPGIGSTFELWLPVRLPDVPAGAPAERPTLTIALASRPLTVLVAEDEAVVRAIVRRGLARAGHRVLLASSGEEALEVARRFDGEIDVLLSDVVMPGIRGPELAERVRAARPGIRVVLASGYTEDEVTRRGIALGRESFLAKPYTIETLLAAVEGCA